ncbi:MAG: helix-turn-helix transcriptional regulator [Candidatus Eremiobacteraeota bacterium]|nr:helix-turn-helix transcriptional regulator [Candidatus Eremiobacteraeota bacterium]MCW5871386.1 helix-turn-helix transcriptional regulator [Candidatus Eremiobacteraeota bacterium]
MLAQLLGVSVRQLCRWETQEAQPRTRGMEARICEILGCTTAELRGWDLSQAA